MHVEKKRIFVGNLPPCIDEKEIRKQFSNYGKVVSVDIKQRKVNTDENVSPVFAFVNVEIDYSTLQKCFQELSDYNWQGYYVSLELAKESFLDRLKREREEAQNEQNTSLNSSKQEQQLYVPSIPPKNNANRKAYHSSSDSENDSKPKQNGKAKPSKKKESSSSSSSSDSEDSGDEKANINNKVKTPIKIIKKKESSNSSSSSSDSSDEEPKKSQKNKQTPVASKENEDGIKLVIKSNKHKVISNGGLKIESVNSTPIHIITKKGSKIEKKDEKSSIADEKRKQSLIQMKNSYNQQKFAIKSALSNIDTKQNKITFDDDGQSNKKRNLSNLENSSSKKQKLALFNDEGDEEYEENIDFAVKTQFEGRKGEKLLALQSRYTNDKRFALDQRFAEDDEQNQDETEAFGDDEKEKQYEILESVLGQKVRKDFKDESRNSNIPRGMLRYDPAKSDHSKFEIKRDEYQKKDKRKEKKEIEREKVEIAPIPEVSKEKFYEVKDNLKESLKEKEGFSLLSMFGRAEEKDDAEYEPEISEEIIKNNKFADYNKNPFKYDSSDTEDEEKGKNKHKKKKEEKLDPRPSFRWTESFFFGADDNRLKEGLDFLKNLNNAGNSELFRDKRRALQRILHGKVKNVEQDKRKFQRKLNKRIKVKKARKS